MNMFIELHNGMILQGTVKGRALRLVTAFKFQLWNRPKTIPIKAINMGRELYYTDITNISKNFTKESKTPEMSQMFS
jgi:hypothetical protein